MERQTLTTHRELRATDISAVREQLGREPSTPFVVTCRCTGGHPLVIRNAPLDADGDPFPTTYWLTCLSAVKSVSRLEADGWIGRMNERIERDEGFDEVVEAAHRSYAQDRASDMEDARMWGGVGGTRTGVKCLHAHYAYHLAGGEDPVGAWVASQVEPVHPEQAGERVAAIDQGTNSIRLLVLEPGASPGEMPRELARDMVITRLGQGVDRTATILPEALERTVAVLSRYCRRARALGATRIRVAATSAVRDASNRDQLAEAVRANAGSELEVISGEREGGLSFLGATFGLDAERVSGAEPPYLVLDIGGGSSETIFGSVGIRAEHAVSSRIGSVRLTERFVAGDPPSPQELRAIEEEAGRVFDEVAREMPVAAAARTLISVAGTATTLQAIVLGLDRYDPDMIHRTWLALDDAERVLVDLARMNNAARADLPVMAPGRGDVIVAGGIILITMMRRFGFERTLVSETDILDGLAFEMLGIG